MVRQPAAWRAGKIPSQVLTSSGHPCRRIAGRPSVDRKLHRTFPELLFVLPPLRTRSALSSSIRTGAAGNSRECSALSWLASVIVPVVSSIPPESQFAKASAETRDHPSQLTVRKLSSPLRSSERPDVLRKQIFRSNSTVGLYKDRSVPPAYAALFGNRLPASSSLNWDKISLIRWQEDCSH